MEIILEYIIWITFFGYTFFVALISYLYTKHDRLDSSDAYFLGGRSFPGVVIAGSLLLTNLSTEQLIGLNGISFYEGAVCMAWETIASVAMVALALFFLPRYLRSGLSTIPEFLEQRYDQSVRNMVNLLFLSGYTFILLPIILYSGSLALTGIFDIKELLNLDQQEALILGIVSIGLVGSAYAIFGGLKAVAISDTLNGVGLLLGGLLIPVFGLMAIGKGSIGVGFNELVIQQADKFNAIGRPDQSVPFSTIFTGMMLVNLFYWCTNQVIVQRVLAAKNLREGQKGVLLAGALKLLCPVILVLPGMIAFQIFGDSLDKADLAYPKLVREVLPTPLIGFFAATLVGAILSSYNSTLNSAATLFSLELYKPLMKEQIDDAKLVVIGRRFSIVLAFASIAVAPLISYAPNGLFGYLQQVNGCYSIPILTIILMGYCNKRTPAVAAKFGLILGVILYSIASFALDLNIHFLHLMALVFLINMCSMYLLTVKFPSSNPWIATSHKKVSLKPWKHAYKCGVAIIGTAVTFYTLCSPAQSYWPLPVALSIFIASIESLPTRLNLFQNKFNNLGQQSDDPI